MIAAVPILHPPSSTLAWVSILFLLASCGTGCAQFTVHPDRPIGPAIVGFGAEMNPYLYCRPNQPEGSVDEQSAADLERKIIALHPQTVRIFLLKEWFDRRADPISKGDPRTAESFFRVVALAQRAGATVNLTYWYEPGWKDPAGQMAWFANLVAQMRNQRQFTCVRYLTVQNEPNLHENKISKDLYARLYLELDQALKRAGVRDQVGIISGDLVHNNERAWFAMLGSRLGAISDGYSIHAYWNYWDTPKILRRLDGPRSAVDALPRDQQRPLFVTEFGVRGKNQNEKTNDPGDAADGSPIATQPLHARELAQFVLNGLNRGFVAFVVWTMSDALYDHPMEYGLIGTAGDGWPLKPGYHMVHLLTHVIEPGWHAVEVSGSAKGLIVSAARGPKGELTILALNTSDHAMTTKVAGTPRGIRQAYVWNGDGTGQTTQVNDAATNAKGTVTFHIPPGALVAATTLTIPNDQTRNPNE